MVSAMGAGPAAVPGAGASVGTWPPCLGLGCAQHLPDTAASYQAGSSSIGARQLPTAPLCAPLPALPLLGVWLRAGHGTEGTGLPKEPRTRVSGQVVAIRLLALLCAARWAPAGCLAPVPSSGWALLGPVAQAEGAVPEPARCLTPSHPRRLLSRHPGGEDLHPSVRAERRRLLLGVPAAERGERAGGGGRAGPRGAALPPVRAAAGCQPGPELPAVRRRRGGTQPAHRLLLPALPLRLPLLQPPQAPHEDTQRGEALRLPAVCLRLCPAGQPDPAPAHAHGGEALPLHVLQLRLQQPGQPQTPRTSPQPGQALPVCRLRLSLQPEPQPEAAHAQPPPARRRGAAPAGQGPRAAAAGAEPARGQRQRPLPARLCSAAGRGGGRAARAALPLHVPHVRAGAGRRLRAGRGPG